MTNSTINWCRRAAFPARSIVLLTRSGDHFDFRYNRRLIEGRSIINFQIEHPVQPFADPGVSSGAGPFYSLLPPPFFFTIQLNPSMVGTEATPAVANSENAIKETLRRSAFNYRSSPPLFCHSSALASFPKFFCALLSILHTALALAALEKRASVVSSFTIP